MNKIFSAVGLASFLAGCAGPQVAFKAGADFSKIRRVGVTTFAGQGGGAAADIFAQDLLSLGLDVVERNRLDAVLKEQELARSGVLDPATAVRLSKVLGVDAIVTGTITSYSPGQSYLVQTGDAEVKVGDGVTALNGRRVYPGFNSTGIPNTQVLSTAASVGLIARLVDAETGSVLWSARMTYEGFDTETAIASVTEAFVKSLSVRFPGGKTR